MSEAENSTATNEARPIREYSEAISMTEKSPVKEDEIRSRPSASTHTARHGVINCKKVSERARKPDTDSGKTNSKRAKEDKHKSRQKFPSAKGREDSSSGSSDSEASSSDGGRRSTSSSQSESDQSAESDCSESSLQTEEGKQTYQYAEEAEPYQRFQPTSKSRMAEWQLPYSLSDYVSKQFSDFTDDAALEESILAHNPVPENVKTLKAPKVDTYLNDIFKTSNRPLDLQVDEGLRRVQQRLLNTMGPLTKV